MLVRSDSVIFENDAIQVYALARDRYRADQVSVDQLQSVAYDRVAVVIANALPVRRDCPIKRFG